MPVSFFKYLLTSLSTGFFLSASAQLEITEFCPSNRTVIYDQFGNSSDWVELHNNTPNPVSLAGFALTDDSLETEKWPLPAITLDPYAYLIIYASGKDLSEGELHTNFSLRAGDEGVYLFQSGNPVDNLFALCVPADKSYGRFPGGSAAIFNHPTPGLPNDTTSVFTPDLTPATISFSHEAGFYESEFDLSITSNAGIKYSLDGDVPDENSDWYTSSVHIKNRLTEDEKYADELTSPEWRKPDGPIQKGTVVRAVAWRDGCPVSPEVTKTYFVQTHYTLPVISITAEGDNLFDEDEGIYVPGIGETANYNQKGDEWEREGYFEYFKNGQPVWSSGVGLRIHGRDSRNRPQKSLRIYARNKYGSDSLYYPFFPHKDLQAYKRLIVRTTWNHRTNSLFKDELAHDLIRDMEVGIMAYVPVILFINGEYWGIHNLRERQDKHYIGSNYDVNSDSLDMLGVSLDGDEEIEGNDAEFLQLMHYVRTQDLSITEHYDYVKDRVDIQSFIDYHIAYLFFANYDWPRNNIRFWREKTNEGKWRWLFFDCDVCFIKTDYNFMQHYVHGSEKYDPYTELFRELMKNPTFKDRFTSSFFSRLNTSFSAGRVISAIDSTAAMYAPEVPEHIRRWHFPGNMESWRSNVEMMKSFAMQRPLVIFNQLSELLGPEIRMYPNPASLQTTVEVSSAETGMLYRIYDISGREMQQGLLTSGQQIDVSNWQAGIYFLVVEVDQLRFNTRFVVVH